MLKTNIVATKGDKSAENLSCDSGLSPEIMQLFKKYPSLPAVAKMLIIAVSAEIGNPTAFTPRHKINEVSKSFPYNHRTLANRDSEGTGPTEKILIGKHVFHRNLSLLEMLCKDLSKHGGAA